MIGFVGCPGYDYSSEDKTLSINEEEAEIVRYIFRRYVEGAGCFIIAKELMRTQEKTKRGNLKRRARVFGRHSLKKHLLKTTGAGLKLTEYYFDKKKQN